MEGIANKFLDELDGLEEKVDNYIDVLLENVDIKTLINEPEMEMLEVVDALIVMIQDEIHPKSAEIGINLARELNDKGKG